MAAWGPQHPQKSRLGVTSSRGVGSREEVETACLDNSDKEFYSKGEHWDHPRAKGRFFDLLCFFYRMCGYFSMFIWGGESDYAGERGVIVGGIHSTFVGLGVRSRDSLSLEMKGKAEGVDTGAGGCGVKMREFISDYFIQWIRGWFEREEQKDVLEVWIGGEGV